jgi:hypothetical protein
MSGRWVDASEYDPPERTPFWRSPTVWLLASFGLLAILLVAGVLIYNRDETAPSGITIAELRADPSGFDGTTVELVGVAEDVRTLPILDQYGLYTIRDDSDSLLVLSRHGTPPAGEPVKITGTYHSDLKLDERLEELIADQLGPLAGAVASTLVPGIPLNVVFIEHERYELQS